MSHAEPLGGLGQAAGGHNKDGQGDGPQPAASELALHAIEPLLDFMLARLVPGDEPPPLDNGQSESTTS
jgi:hypothetical protein